jgi:hypothetical protein
MHPSFLLINNGLIGFMPFGLIIAKNKLGTVMDHPRSWRLE